MRQLRFHHVACLVAASIAISIFFFVRSELPYIFPLPELETTNLKPIYINRFPILDAEICREPVWHPPPAITEGPRSVVKVVPALSRSTRSKTFALVVPSWPSDPLDPVFTKHVVNTVSMIRMHTRATPISILVLLNSVTRGGSDAKSGSATTEQAMGKLKEALKALENEIVKYGYEGVSLHPIDPPSLHAETDTAAVITMTMTQRAIYVATHAFGLPFDKVLLLSFNSEIVKAIDHLFDCDQSDFIFSGEVSQPSLLIIPANETRAVVESMARDLQKAFKEKQKQAALEVNVVDALTAVYSKYAIRIPPQTSATSTHDSSRSSSLSSSASNIVMSPRVMQLRKCVYSYKSNLLCDEREFKHTALSPYVISLDGDGYGYGHNNNTHIRTHEVREAALAKPCRCDYWIIGARKGGTTALYTAMTEHPQLERLHMWKNELRGGEVYERVSDLGAYNRAFEQVMNNNSTVLAGDAAVARLHRDGKALPRTCGHSHVKYFVLLRDPIERAYSNYMMRVRAKNLLEVTEKTNVTEYILKDLMEFKAKEKKAEAADTARLYKKLTMSNLIDEGVYYLYLREWFYYNGIDNIRVYFSADFANHTEAVVRDALQLVGVDDTLWQPTYESMHHVANARNHSEILLDNQIMSPLLIAMLKETFAPYNRMLENLLNVTLPWKY